MFLIQIGPKTPQFHPHPKPESDPVPTLNQTTLFYPYLIPIADYFRSNCPELHTQAPYNCPKTPSNPRHPAHTPLTSLSHIQPLATDRRKSPRGGGPPPITPKFIPHNPHTLLNRIPLSISPKSPPIFFKSRSKKFRKT